MSRATLRQLLWVCIISAVKVEARLTVNSEEKTSPWVNPYYEFCEQIQCLRVEDIFTQTVNLYENPCTDYYKYACSRNYNPLRDHSQFSQNANQVFNDLEEILAEDLARKLDQGNEALAIERRIFKLCQSGGDAFDSGEKQHYANVLANFGANRLLHTQAYTLHEAKRWDEADLRYALKGFGFTFFDVEIYQHTNEDSRGRQPRSGRYILIKPPTYSLSQLTALLIEYFIKQQGSPHSYRNNKYERLKGFIDSFRPYVERAQEDVEWKTQNAKITFMKIEEWQRSYNDHANEYAKINWLDYLNKLFNAARVQAPLRTNTLIAIQHQDYFLQLAGFLKDTADNDAIVDYVHLHFVSKSVGLADRNFTEYSILPQFKELVCTPGLLVGAAYRYADEHFPEENRKLLQDSILKLKDTVIARVEDVIRNEIRFSTERIQTRLNDFVNEYRHAEVYAGYPDWLMNGTTAYSIYGHSTTGPFSSLYEYQVSIIERLLRAKLLPLVTPSMPIIDLTELRKGFESNKIKINSRKKKIDVSSEKPQENHSSSRKLKEIVIPFGYFNEKDYRFFSSQLFDPINYGAAATEVAFKLYWDLLKSIDYESIAPRCVKDQVPNHVANKDEFIQRAAAYLLALEAAHASWPSKNFYPIQFVDFGAITDSDLFFLSFAESLCTIPPRLNEENVRDPREEQSSYRINEQNLLPHYINFTLQNFQPFLENYKCQKNPKMSSEKKCDPLDFSLP